MPLKLPHNYAIANKAAAFNRPGPWQKNLRHKQFSKFWSNLIRPATVALPGPAVCRTLPAWQTDRAVLALCARR